MTEQQIQNTEIRLTSVPVFSIGDLSQPGLI